jgi:beta-glucanase (GH16 family)
LDLTKWAPQFGNGGWGNNEWQYYTNAAEKLAVENGQLVITARHEGTGATEYTSARIITKGLFDFQYGKVEARMKLPLGQGLWPAFWTLGANIDDVSWPQCGEIDIMEHVSNDTPPMALCIGRITVTRLWVMGPTLTRPHFMYTDWCGRKTFCDGM